MNLQHDPMRQVSYLQQCLSQDKKPLGIFIGAGCPLAIKVKNDDMELPLIPDIAGITVEVRKRLSESVNCAEYFKVVEGNFKKDGRNEINVEDILSHVRALHNVAGKDTVRGLNIECLDKLDTEICTIIYEIANKKLPNTNTPYHRVAAWISATPREVPVEIFTTNYDLLMEQAFEDYRVPYFDGFVGGCQPFFDIRATEEDKLPSRWARFWKLHGSINWYQDKSKGVFRGTVSEQRHKRVIHPSHLKYDESRRMPYLAMIDRMRMFFKQPSAALIICGYSFRDDHINEVIIQGLQGNPTSTAFALLFDSLKTYPKAIRLAIDRSNMILLAKDEAIIGGNQASWTEKDSDSVPANISSWVTWTSQNSNNNKTHSAKFCLGDFVTFGAFIQEIIGQEPRQIEELNAK